MGRGSGGLRGPESPTERGAAKHRRGVLYVWYRFCADMASAMAIAECGVALDTLLLRSHDSAVCRDVYKHIARMAHPDKNPTRDAYHCAVADIAMDAAQRVSGMVASSSSSNRSAFHLLPALDSTQFSARVEAHRLARIDRSSLGRSSPTPSTAGGHRSKERKRVSVSRLRFPSVGHF